MTNNDICLMKSTAIDHLEQMQQDAQQAAEKHGSMQTRWKDT